MFRDLLLQASEVYITFEVIVGIVIRREMSWNINCGSTAEFDVRPRGIEMCVAEEYLSLSPKLAIKDSFGSTALMGREYVFKSFEVSDLIIKYLPTLGTGVGFVATHDAGPLLTAHRRGSAVGQKVDDHMARM